MYVVPLQQLFCDSEENVVYILLHEFLGLGAVPYLSEEQSTETSFMLQQTHEQWL